MPALRGQNTRSCNFISVRRAHVAAVLAAMAALASRARADETLPQRPQVTHGGVAISTAGRHMTVNQSTRYGIVNWDSFSVGSGSSVHFNNGSGATLNRVTGLSASRIDGTVSATGSLFLLNRNGIILGSDGRILTGGDFVGSTRDMSDADFLDGGDFTLFGNSPSGVTNLGKISSTGGNILLAGYTVKNSGSLEAPAGRVGLVTADRIDVLTDASWLNGAYGVSLGQRGQDITNEGRILAAVAELRAHAGNIYALAGNNTGLVHATGVRTEGGRVILTADQGVVQSSGTLAATRADSTGGDIALTAVSIENYGGTQDVSGTSGGSITLSAESITTDTEMLARGTSGPGGSITLSATREILFTSAGRIDASGATAGGTVALLSGPGANILSGQISATASFGLGGTVNLLGDRVSLLGTTVDASGFSGGGQIHVGGGYQGASVLPSVANSSRTYVSDRTTLRADATGAHGDGGLVVAWADGTTEFAGNITARSGTASGDGGTVETSGLEALGVSGTVDASARGTSSTGANGRWLLDPKNITIGSGFTDAIGEFRSVTATLGGTATDSNVEDIYFGQFIDVSGDTLIAGSRRANAAYIFEAGRIVARITGVNAGPGTDFGGGVQIVGNIAAVMASNQGTAYVFAKGTGWRNGTTNQTAAIPRPSGAFPASSEFGNPGSGTNDNSRFKLEDVGGALTLFIGDPGATSQQFSSTNSGAVYYQFISSTGQASGFFGEYRPTGNPANARFGHAIATSGSYIFITYGDTARSSDLTVARLNNFFGDFTNILPNAFTLNNLGMAAEGLTLYIPNRGFSVDMLSFAESSGANFVTYLGTRTLGLNLSAIGNSATSIAVSGDTLVLGNPFLNNFNGGFAAYQRPAGGWAAAAALAPVLSSAPTGTPRHAVGASVAVDGDYLVVGAPGVDSATHRDNGNILQYRRTAGVWTQAATLNPAESYLSSNYGASLDLEGDTWVIGDHAYGSQTGRGHGRAYVYENGQLAATLTGNSDLNLLGLGLGYRVAISGDRILAVGSGADGNGRAFNRINLYEKGSGWRNGDANYVTAAYSSPSTTLNQINSLLDVSLAFEGDTIAFGRPMFDGTFNEAKGAVDIFGISGGSIFYNGTYRSPINFSGGGSRDYFGVSVALSGNTLVVGAASYDFQYIPAEYIHLYERTGPSWMGITPTSIPVFSVTGGVLNERGLGGDLALDGDTLVVGYGRRDVAGSRGVYVFERNGSWATSTTPAARLTHPEFNAGNPGYFGSFVALDGDTLAIMGNRTPTVSTASAYIFRRQDDWRDGTANHIATLRTSNKITALGYGAPLALDGDTLLMAGSSLNAFSSSVIPVSEFRGPFDFSSRATFATGPGDNLAISAASLTASLSLGTNITLQANNDITISEAITVNNPAGDGGDLTLQAGRRILVNASIATDNGDLTLVADAPGANASFRDAGERVVVLGRDSFNASVTLALGTGDLVIAAAQRFENRTGASNPFRFDATAPGRWLVYSTTPDQTGAPDATNLLADLSTTGRDWVHYNRAFNLADPAPASLPAGDGFIYTVQPTLGVTVGNASLTYGQPVVAQLTRSGFFLGGQPISASVFGLQTASIPDLVDQVLAPSVSINSANGFVNAGSYPASITAVARATVTTGSVFGLAVNATGAGDLAVAKKTLDVRPADATRIYRDANPALTAAYTGFVTGDSISVLDTPMSLSTTAALASPVGNYPVNATGGLDNNYAFNVVAPGRLSVTRRDLALTGLVALDRVYDGNFIAPLGGTPAIAPLGGDQVVLATGFERTAYFDTKDAGLDKPVTSFAGFSLSGAQANNYTLVFPTNLVADVTPAPINLDITVLDAADRDYDGTRSASLTSGILRVTPLRFDELTVTGTPVATFADANAGVDKTVTLSGLALGGPDAANYLFQPSLVATIRPLALDVTGLSALHRVYDATRSATLAGTPAVAPLGSDSVSLVTTALAATFADRHVGADKPVTVTGLSLTGPAAANYVLRAPSGLTADITPADLLVTGLAAASRVYDATDLATLVGTAAVAPLGQDSVTVTGAPAATFADRHAGAAKPVSVSGYTLAGPDAANYVVVQPAGLTADITPRALTLSGLVLDDKTYDATPAATATGAPVFGGIFPVDDAVLDATNFTYAFADKHVGQDKPLVLSGLVLSGAHAANYDITSATGLTASITPATLTVTGVTALNRSYNSTTTVALSGGSLSGVIGRDDIVFSTAAATGTLATKDASLAPRPVTASGFAITGDDAANYTLLQPAGLTATISRAALNLVGLSADKTYDGLATATLTAAGLDAVFTGDLVSPDLSAVTAAFTDKHAGLSRAVTLSGLFGLSGDDALNYTLTQPASLTGTIAPRAITVSGLTIADKTYDGTRTGQISGTGAFGGVLPGDDLAIDVGAIDVSFADANAGANKTISLSGVTLSGADKDNYTAATPAGITATIFQKELTLSGLAALDRVYDRTPIASLTGTGLLSGLIPGESVTLNESARAAAFADKHVGAAKPVTVSGLVLENTATGLAANYRIAAPDLAATITPAFADVTGLTAVNRIYDTTTNAPLAGAPALDFGSLQNVLASAESVSLAGIATGSFADKHASLAPKAVTVSGLSLAGPDAANYVLRHPTGLTATIARADLAVTGAAIADRAYDATRAAAFSAFGTVAPLGSDSVVLVTTGATATFADKHASLTPKPVAATGYALSGPDADNYTVIDPAGLTATISRAELPLTGLVALDRFYDRSNTAQLSGTPAVTPFGSDSVTLAGTASATFFDKGARDAKAVTITGLSLTGPEAGNYTLFLPTLFADVAPRFVNIGGLSAENRVYDGTSVATLSGEATFDGFLPGDDLGFDLAAITATFADKRVGLGKPVSLSGDGLIGRDATNYAQVLPFDLVADIAAKELSVIGADAIDRIYDRTLSVALQGGALAGTIVGDAVTLVTSAASGAITAKNAQLAPKPVTASGYALSGDDASNYTLAQPVGIDVVISPRPVDIAGVRVADKLFDGTTRATISGGTLANTVPGDDLALVTTGASARFETSDIANDKTVLLEGFALTGADALNYALNPSPVALGRILPALKDITDVVPAEVLRSSSNSALEQRRAELTAAAAARVDQVKLFDYQALSDQVSAGLVVARPVMAIYNTPLDQQDAVTRAYIDAANAAQAASRRAESIVMDYRTTAIAYKETGQKINQVIRDLSVERDLRATYVAQIDQIQTQLAQADKNLAAISDAKRNIAEFTQKLADAARLGRGSEVAEYERILSSARAIVATEADTLAKRDALAKELAPATAKLAASDAKVAELADTQAKLETTLAAQKETLDSTRAQAADAKTAAAAANEKLLAAQAAGAAAYADAGSTLAQADALRSLAASDLPARTAAAMAESDAFVQQFEARAAAAAQVTSTLGQGLASTLSPDALAYAKSVAEKINSGGLLDDSAAMRDSLVKSVPALRALQTQLDAAEQRQAQESAAFEARIAETAAARANVMRSAGIVLTPEQIAADAAQEKARLNARLNQLTGGALDLSKVPTKNASGEALTELERIAIAILNKQLDTPQGAASEAATFASGYKDRLNSAVAEEFGFSPEQALNDPRVLANEVVARVPLNSDGSLDKEQLAENLKTAASAYVNLSGSLKDEAIQQAATQDPTGAAQAYVGAEKAARAEFVKTYGGQPEDVITDKINARIDAYKNADSPEALMRVHAASMVPGGEMTIEQATQAYNDLRSGKSPDAVVKDMATNLWKGDGTGPSAGDQAAQAARTAEAAKAAAISSLEEADKTGLFKASNTINNAASEEFAKTFGGTPQELGIKALENPADAANQVKDAAKDIFTTPDGALNAVKGGIATYSNMADATLNAAKQQLDVVAEKFGGPGKAAAFIAKHGITAATEVKDFLQDGLSTVTGGLVPKSGPSKAEVEAAVAYAKAQDEVYRAEAQKREDAMLLQYFAAAQQLAQRKAEMAAGVVNAKAQVGQYLVAAQAQAKQQQTAAVAKEVMKTELTNVVRTGLQEKADATQSRVASTLTTEQMQARAALWSN